MNKHNDADTKIEVLDLSVRVYNSVRRNGVVTTADLVTQLYLGRDVIRKKGIFWGEAGFRQILHKLEENGYLPDDLPLDVDVRDQEKRLKWILVSQEDNGCWYKDLEITTAATLSLIRASRDDYAVKIEKGIEWIQKQDTSSFDTTTGAITRLLAEYHNSEIPEFQYSSQIEPGQRTASDLQGLRQIALMSGNVIKNDKYAYYHEDRLGSIYSHVEIAWMTVGQYNS